MTMTKNNPSDNESDNPSLPGYIIEGYLEQDDGQWYFNREDEGEDIPLEAVVKNYEGNLVRFTLAGVKELQSFVASHQDD
jgi:hypothetical protein